MRICLLGSSSTGGLDEGMKNYAHHLFHGLSVNHSVIVVDPRLVGSAHFWREVKSFQPEVVHYISGPSSVSLLTLKLVKWQTSAKTIVSAIHPWFPAGTDLVIRILPPDIVLAPSKRTRSLFSKHGCKVKNLLIGVDINQFIPVTQSQKTELRQRYHLAPERYVILHVGHIRKRRGIEALAQLQSEDQQVVVIGSQSSKSETKTHSLLEQAGCVVISQYIPKIEDYFALSDCYVFPTSDPLSAIEIPLSVLEAMASNLPIIAYPFGGLPDLFQAGEGLVFEENLERWTQQLQTIRKENLPVTTRNKVLHLDWPIIVRQHENIYRDIQGN
jgi:glycosyltransferase involved in cell wall biosynthesis